MRSAAVATTLALALLSVGSTAFAASPPTVGLGTSAAFAILAGTPDITNTGPSTVNGDVGIHPAVAVSGFPPGTVNGTIHAGDAVALQAKSDLVTAYNDAAGRPVTTVVAAGALGGLTLVGGVYNAGGVSLNLTGTLTLDAQNDPNAVWIFQATSDLITASSSTVTFINGGNPCNVFWQVTSSATLGSGSTFVGTILALTSITMATGVSMQGRALAQNGTVTLINDSITRPTCTTTAPTAAPVAPTAAPAAPTAAPATPTTPPTATLESAAASTSGPVVVVVVMAFVVAFFLVTRFRTAGAIRHR